jgi:hypothetical protein
MRNDGPGYSGSLRRRPVGESLDRAMAVTAAAVDRMVAGIDPAALRLATVRIEEAKRSLALFAAANRHLWPWAMAAAEEERRRIAEEARRG